MDIAAGESGYHLPYFEHMLAARTVGLQGIIGVLKVAVSSGCPESTDS